MSKTIRMSQGAKFRAAITNNDPLQIVGTINAYSAIMPFICRAAA
jgi:methylisocitrate lyase